MSLNDANQALAALREANDRIAEGYRYAMMDHHQQPRVRLTGEPIPSFHAADMQREWSAALQTFADACSLAEPEIDASLRLADVDSVDSQFLSVEDFAGFDRHVHELFGELRLRWPALASEPSLTDHDDDDRALRSDWRIALEQRPVTSIAIAVFIVVFFARFLWMIITNM